MKASTQYCIAAIVCALIIAGAYLITHRYEWSGYGLVQRDNWTGRLYLNNTPRPTHHNDRRDLRLHGKEKHEEN